MNNNSTRENEKKNNCLGASMENELSRLTKLEPKSYNTTPFFTAGGVLVLAFAATSIYLIQSSMSLQDRIERRAGWMIALEKAQERLSFDGQQDAVMDAREKLLFDKDTVGQILQVRLQIMEEGNPRDIMVSRLDRLYQLAFRFNALLSENRSTKSLVPLRDDLDVEIQGVMNDLQRVAAHETIEMGGKWHLMNGLAAMSIILMGLVMFLVRVLITRGRKLQVALDWVKRVATKDELTGLWNRRAIFPILNKELSRCERENRALSVLMVDFDHFKQVNDRFGHKAGDAVLREGSQRLLSALRPYDSIGRYGGEEIIILLPGCDSSNVSVVAERLAEIIRNQPFDFGEHRIPTTVSIGGATKRSPTPAHSDRLVVSADQYLYEAKTNGRNRVVTGPSLSYDGDVSDTGA